MRSNYPICHAAAWLVLVTAGCGSNDRRPSLPITSDNASLIATAVLVDSAELGRLSAELVVGAPVTHGCIQGARTTTASSTARMIELDHCTFMNGEAANGTVTYPLGPDSSGSVTVDLMITMGEVNITQSGSHGLVHLTPGANGDDVFDLTADSLHATSAVGATPRDELTAFDVHIHETNNVMHPSLFVTQWTESYQLESVRIGGRFTVATTTTLVHVSDGSQYPASGELEITGADRSRLLITVAGDELSVPRTGEDFIKLEVDPGTGTLGAARWLSWAALSAAL
jgi:hypothetical protein